MENYDDIINTQWPPSSKKNYHPSLPLNQRAKIFLPFSALTGYDDALKETLENEIQSMQFKTGSIKFYDDVFE